MWYSENSKEQELVQLLKKRDSKAMKEMYCLYAEYLSAVGSRYIPIPEDLRDVLQDSFIKIFTSIDQFEFRGEGSLRAWASRIVVNESLKFLKRNEKLSKMERDEEIPDIPDEEDPDTEEVPAEVIQEMIQQLPVGYRTVFNLYVFEEKSHKEIAALLHIKEDTSASQLHRAKNLLAKQIRNYKSLNHGRTMD